MFNITNHQGNRNQNYHELSPYTLLKKVLVRTWGNWNHVGEIAKWCHYGKWYGGSSN